jgi:hypothetical protein
MLGEITATKMSEVVVDMGTVPIDAQRSEVRDECAV